jgi:hypothetical protein
MRETPKRFNSIKRWETGYCFHRLRDAEKLRIAHRRKVGVKK